MKGEVGEILVRHSHTEEKKTKPLWRFIEYFQKYFRPKGGYTACET